MNLYNTGDFFGYKDLIHESNFTETITALEDSEICLIPKKDFNTLLYSNLHVAQKFIQLLSKNVNEKESTLLKLAYNSVRKRISEALLQFGADEKAPIKISREDLANLAGTTQETAIRTLSDFSDEKLIEIEPGKIFILNWDKLKRLKN